MRPERQRRVAAGPPPPSPAWHGCSGLPRHSWRRRAVASGRRKALQDENGLPHGEWHIVPCDGTGTVGTPDRGRWHGPALGGAWHGISVFGPRTRKGSIRPWEAGGVPIVTGWDGRNFLDCADQRHPSIRQSQGVMEHLRESGISEANVGKGRFIHRTRPTACTEGGGIGRVGDGSRTRRVATATTPDAQSFLERAVSASAAGLIPAGEGAAAFARSVSGTLARRRPTY